MNCAAQSNTRRTRSARGRFIAIAPLMRGRIARLLVEANAAGELDVDDPAILAEAVYTTYNGALITWAIDGSGSLTDWIRGRIRSVLAPYGAGGVT